MSASIHLEAVTKSYDGVTRAVDAVSLNVRQGEFFSLLGPSGCGKTTTLRMIAGFEEPNEGRILIGDDNVTHVPAHKRNMGMVFQNYALFPHRTVAENVAFGLRMRRLDRATIATKVKEALALVELDGFADRYPAQLSGGQQQRVALARAIVITPRVLLCDESLGALDKKLRQQMQFELKKLQRDLGLTLVFVTHDQEEALAMSDRIAVMNAGKVEQIGSPSEIYDRPVTRFVADFIGDTNLFQGAVTASANGAMGLSVEGFETALPLPASCEPKAAQSVALRPEKIALGESLPGHDSALTGTVDNVNFQGGSVLYKILAGTRSTSLLVKQPNHGPGHLFSPGNEVRLSWSSADLVLLKD
jgi:putative spermidine/putrescine transport system ATP-binding protein